MRGGNDATLGTSQGKTVKDVTGVAMILVNPKVIGDTTFEVAHVLPATTLGHAEEKTTKSYISSSPQPRGPNSASPGILKPDIIGPGVNILAAWLFSMENIKGTDSIFNIIPGTSMSCPHLSDIAALLKSAHLNWSPAAIKFAIMTTADQSNHEGQPILDERKLPADVFAIEKEIGLIVHQSVNCSIVSSISEAELNYPSFSVVFGSENQNYTRRVTNVCDANSIYVVSITQILGVHTVVEPIRLVFTKVNQQATYMISFTRTGEISGGFVQGSISWISEKHVIRSSISISLNQGILVNESQEIQIGFKVYWFIIYYSNTD
ncbi:PREDICTED: subtilisin-like protease SBT1.2 [Nicotiana attenuata]|uniref:subtilisin-like protease SBT1.2 n=1 Tax=Nicotiana attenuata TaxID=49451 RepID=UPI000904E496|nr:PREDICTED: subtilisin-like protease SBT1.2 [Nicotiana attenuata]